jgi:hypothetical protein
VALTAAQPMLVPAGNVECLLVSSALNFCDSASPGVGCINRIKRLSIGINDWILTKDLSINK